MPKCGNLVVRRVIDVHTPRAATEAAASSNSTSPYNDFSSNGAYPLISVSHPRGSLQLGISRARQGVIER